MKVDARELLKIGIALSSEKDRNKLLYLMIKEAMRFTNCDGGTLYTCDGECLKFKVMITISQNVHSGEKGEEINIPPVPMKRENVCANSALTRRVIRIDDVYKENEFDFSGPRKYDGITGYHTQSMLVVPLEDDRGNIIGVLQLINAQTADGKVTSFDEEDEELVKSLASQTAISLTNVNYARELEELLNSFVRMISAAIDARTPYNANHSRNMAKNAVKFIDWLEETGNPWQFDEIKKRAFLMTILLHDIGKMVIPLYVMNKENRLGEQKPFVKARLEKIALLNRIAALEGKMSDEEAAKENEDLKKARELFESLDTKGFVTDEELALVEDFGSRTFINESGEKETWLTEHEKRCLSIRKGTLLDEERAEMEGHVVMTHQFLKEIQFNNDYKDVIIWASKHHEYINGTGYPIHISGEDIEPEVRLLTILDIFDSLTAADRPYKPAIPAERALKILDDMAEKEGKLDKDILALFKESMCWKE